ncbi:MAG: 50S ribosomal protein L18 [Candidatus Aenigmarchaeota archaeon]|nr:50S ribosomal protein L18 [Candidatus Aenigmarchaeota archaeon]
MKHSPTYTMPFKRRRLGKTDYTNRLKLLSSKKPRLVVRRSSNYITAQIINFELIGDKTLVSASSKELKKMGWKFSTDNLPASYLTGMIVAKKAGKKGIKEAILDSGLYASTKGNRIYAVVKGAIDGGLNIPINEEILPTEDRIKGTHISKNQEKFKQLPDEFEKIKGKI